MRGFELIKGYDGKLPVRGTPYSACVDFYACEDVILRPGTISNIIPTDTSLKVSDVLATAQMDTMDFASIVQPLQSGMAQYWTPAESMGKEIVAGTVTHENAAEKTESMNKAMNTASVQ